MIAQKNYCRQEFHLLIFQNTLVVPPSSCSSYQRSGKKFDKVESKMQSIQASLGHSVSSHPHGSLNSREKEARSSVMAIINNSNSSNSNQDTSSSRDEIERLKKDLEKKENFITE